VSAEFYDFPINGFSAMIKKKPLEKEKKQILFHQDNAPVHTRAVAMAKSNELQSELIPRPPYSPAPSDFLVPKLEETAWRERISNKRCCRRSRERLFFRFGVNVFF